MKKIISIVLILTMVIGLLCGCGKEDPKPTTQNPTQPAEKTYSVNCVDQNGDPVANVILQWVDEKNNQQLAVSDSDGKVSITGKVAMVSMNLTSAPAGYTSTESVYQFEGKTELTIVLNKEASQDNMVTYKITVVDQNGNPVSGVVVQICDEENCKLPMTTDENGFASAEYAESNYHVTLNTLPDGYESEQTEFYFDGATEITIAIHAKEGN